MFTGLIEETSELLTKSDAEGGLLIEIKKPATFNDIKDGDSISVDGACLTLMGHDEEKMKFFVGLESLSKTRIQQTKVGDKVNLERSLKFADRLGGHWVTGHADDVGLVSFKKVEGQCLSLRIQLPLQLLKWTTDKGSICINGVSLTMNKIDRDTGEIDFFLIPATLERTNLSQIDVGQFVNIECDFAVKVIAELVENSKGKNELHA